MQPSMSSFHLPVDRNVVIDVGRVDMHLGFRLHVENQHNATDRREAWVIRRHYLELWRFDCAHARTGRKKMIRSTQSIATQ